MLLYCFPICYMDFERQMAVCCKPLWCKQDDMSKVSKCDRKQISTDRKGASFLLGVELAVRPD